MKLSIVTIVLDGMKFLPTQFYTFSALREIDWTWYIAEGRAKNILDTSWCKDLAPRLSLDGTTAYLNFLKVHPRIKVLQQQSWLGKTSMFNALLEMIKQPCLLLQVDVDEIWTPEKITGIVDYFLGHPRTSHARFDCIYHVGPNIITVTDNAYGHNPGEWLRAWRFEPGMRFLSHEPPRLEDVNDADGGSGLNRNEARRRGLWFTHMAYVYPEQVQEKEQYYGYKDALQHWYRLQQNSSWPCALRSFFPWCDNRAHAHLLYLPK